MRKIEAIICSDKLDTLRKAFLQEGIQKMTVTEVRDYGSQKEHIEIYRSKAFSIDSLVMTKVEIIVPQKKVSAAVSIIMTKVHAGKSGENKILVSSVNDVTQVYSNEKGESV